MIQLFAQTLAVSAFWALLVSLGGLLLSLLNFSHTGPEIRAEIATRFRGYTALSLLRQTAWVFLIVFWLSGFGQILYLAQALGGKIQISFAGMVLAGTLASVVLCGFQFLRYLLLFPSVIMMSFPYDIRRLYPVWRPLTVSRLRWAGLVLAVAYFAGIVNGLTHAQHAKPLLWILAVWLLPWVACLELPESPRLWPKRRRLQNPNPPLNLLLIGCDTLRVDRLLEDYPRNVAPFLKTLTRRGTLFTRCYTPIARTAPSLTTLLTGTNPQIHGIFDNFIGDEQKILKVQSLPAILAEAGYHTEAISDWSGSDLGKFSFGFKRLFLPPDQWNFKYLIRQGPKELRLFLSLFCHNRLGRLLLPELYFLAGSPLTGDLGRLARKRLGQLASGGKPFCLTVFLGTCHPPFGSEYPYYRLYADPHYQGASLFAMARLTEPFEIIRSQREPREAFDLDQIIALYDGCVRCFDDEVRKIFHHLKRCGLDRNTVVAILSDHGMELFEHGTWGQGNSAVGEQSNRIPVLIVAPQYAGQGQVDAIIRAQDIAPTLLDCLGIAPSSSMTGVSLRSFLAGEQPLPDLAATFCTGLWLTRPPGMAANHLCYPDLSELLFIPDPQSGTLVIKPEFREQIERARDVAICWRHWKLVRLALNPRPRYLLFNLAEDPSCHEDVADRFPEVAGTLRSWLEQSSKFD